MFAPIPFALAAGGFVAWTLLQCNITALAAASSCLDDQQDMLCWTGEACKQSLAEYSHLISCSAQHLFCKLIGDRTDYRYSHQAATQKLTDVMFKWLLLDVSLMDLRQGGYAAKLSQAHVQEDQTAYLSCL